MLRISENNVLFTRLGFDKRYLLHQPTFTADLCKWYVRAIAGRNFAREPRLTVREAYDNAISQMARDISELFVCVGRIKPQNQADAFKRYEDFGIKHHTKELGPVQSSASGLVPLEEMSDIVAVEVLQPMLF